MQRAGTVPLTQVHDEDRSVVARAAAGEREATRALYHAHVDRVYRLAWRICRDSDLAAELTQEVFVQVFRSLGRFRGDAAFTTWLHRVAVTTCINGMRRLNRHRIREADLDEAVQHHAASDPLAPDLRDALHRAIAELPEGLRITLVMHELEGYTHAEIADSTGVTEGTSKRRLFDARARLRESMARYREG